MVVRIASVMSLLAFALSIVVGAFEANNPFGTTVERALTAMIVTLLIGLIVGAAFKAMLNENLSQESEKLKNPPGSPAGTDR